MAKTTRQRLTRQQSRLETRTRLLASAAQVFARDGYEGASLDLIAENAGYSKGAFYSNFAGKEAIFLDLLEAHKQREIGALETMLAQEIPVAELLSLIRNYDPAYEADFDCGLLSAEFQLQASRDQAFAKRYSKLHRTHRDMLAGLIDTLFAKLGRTPPSPTQNLASILMGVTTGLSLQRTSAQGSPRKGFLAEAYFLVLGLDKLEPK